MRKSLWIILFVVQTYGFSAALHQAASKGNWVEVKRLLDEGADVDGRDLAQRTALMFAVKNDREPIEDVAEISTAKTQASDRSKRWAKRRLTYVEPQLSGTKTVDVLLRYHADVEAKDADGWTALMIASLHNMVPMITKLLDAGAYTETRDHSGWTALMVAGYAGQMESIRVLLNRNANIRAESKSHSTATSLASKNGFLGAMEVMRQLSIKNKRHLLERDLELMVKRGLGTLDGYQEGFFKKSRQ